LRSRRIFTKYIYPLNVSLIHVYVPAELEI